MTKILKNLLLFFSIALATIYLASCEKYSYKVEPPAIIEDTVFFSVDIQPIFDAKCVSCHKASLPPDLRPDRSYKALTDGGYVNLPVKESKLAKILDAASHTAYTNQEEKSKIISWIFQGAEDN